MYILLPNLQAMDGMVVIALLLFALLLIVIEIAIIPGTTFVGIGGFILLLVGLAAGFYYFGWQGGWMILGITGLSLAGVFYFVFKTSTWKNLSLNATSLGRLSKNETTGLTVGAEGITVSSLRPAGNVEINDKVYEVKTLGEFISTSARVQIVQITPDSQIIVKSI